MCHVNRWSIKNIFLFIQIIVISSIIIILSTNIFMISKFNVTLRVMASKNEALSNIFIYNEALSETISQYILNKDEETKERYEYQKKSCMEEFEELMTDVFLHRTKVMFIGLKNMYLNSFAYADEAIRHCDEAETAQASGDYRRLIKNSELISDVFRPMYAYNTEDINFYLTDTLRKTQSLTTLIMIIQFLATAFIIEILYCEMKKIREKIAMLSVYADSVSRQQYESRLEECCQNSDNELDKLGVTMTKMAASIKNYVAIIEEKDRQALQQTKIENEYLKLYSTVRDTEIKALNSQINPHFLYNTLGIVSQLCHIEGAQQASRMLESVIDAFQYITRASNSITDLGSEIDFLKNYFYICGVRYQNKISFYIDVQENIPNIKLPGMLLQPIVENSVLHGLDNCIGNGEIHVSFSYDANNIYITTEDNGVGMDYEDMEEIMLGETNESEHIGVSNVLRRLRLYFGKQADVTISSEENCGTLVTIIIPIN